jgi:hypothetical protein
MISSSLLIGLISRQKSLAKITAIFFLITMFMCFVLISLKGFGLDYRMTHYLEDLFLSPFFILVFIVIIKAFKLDNSTTKEKEN